MPSKTSLGLYFNDSFIEISQLSSDGTRLEKFNKISLLQGLVVNGEIKNPQSFIQILKQLLSTAKPSGINPTEVVVGVNDSRVFLRELTIPNISGKNLDDAIDYQVRSLLPVLPPGVETDWQIIGKNEEGQIEVLLAAIPRNIVESYVSICASVGLSVTGIEPSIFGVIRIIDPTLLTGKNLLLVHLGEGYGVFSFVTSGNPRFSEFLPQSEIDKNGSIENTVQTYISFANQKHPNRPVEGVIVTGSSTEIDGVIGNLVVRGLNAGKAISRLRQYKDAGQNLLNTSNGLCLKNLETSQTVNLLPIDFRLGVLRQKMVSRWKVLLGILIVLTIAGTFGLGYLYNETLNRRTRLQVMKSQAEQELALPESKQMISQTDRLNQISGQLVTLRGVVGGEENILRQLSAVTPNGINISSLIYTRGVTSKKLVDATGTWILTGSANSRALVLDFYNNLISTPEFANGQLYFGSLEKDIGLTFRIASKAVKK